MECLTCIQARDIPNCLTELVVGIIAYTNTDLKVRLQTFFGRVEEIETTSNADGLITLNLSDIELANGIYKIMVYVANDPANQLEVVTDDGAIGYCIEFRVMDGTSESVTITSK